MSCRGWLLSLGLAALAALHASPSVAQPAPRVVVVAPSASNAIVARMRQELRVLRIEVDVVTAGARPDELPEIARAHGAGAAALVEVAPAAVVLWAAPNPGGGGDATSALDATVSSGADAPEEALLALRAVELLRGRLIPVAARPEGTGVVGPVAPLPPPAVVAPPAVSAPLPGARPAREEATAKPGAAPKPATAPASGIGPAIALGPAVLASPGGLGALGQAALAARFHVTQRASVELTSFLPITAASVSAPEGTMRLRVGAFGAAAGVTLTRPSAALFVSAALGVGAMFLAFDADAGGAWLAASGTRWAVFPNARLGTGYRLGRGWALRGDATVGTARPEPVLRSAGRDLASFGQPAAIFSVGVEVQP